jgi:hypothetical protein
MCSDAVGSAVNTASGTDAEAPTTDKFGGEITVPKIMSITHRPQAVLEHQPAALAALARQQQKAL